MRWTLKLFLHILNKKSRSSLRRNDIHFMVLFTHSYKFNIKILKALNDMAIFTMKTMSITKCNILQIFISKSEVISNSNDIGINLYGVICKKFHMSLLHDHFGCMVILGPFQRQFRNNYFIFKPIYFITPSFSY